MARKDSDNADLGLSKTARLLKDCFTPTTPISGIDVRLETSSVYWIELFIKKIPKTNNKGVIIGGLIFGLGWAITGACPGPLFAQIGSGFTVIIVTFLSAVAGTWVYGYFQDKLPH